ncbi:MAG: aldo/keto reductase [Candidatus Lokiarchaeota archaeon]|nr:aldo/keto reductase [Candidatus Lokiarchaeota archaeon]
MLHLTINSTIELNNGIKIPRLGLGTYSIPEIAISHALKIGYRLLDTARMYGNENEVGNAIRKSNLTREDVFITSKVWYSNHGYDSTLKEFKKSLKALAVDYIDLYLIHWPAGKAILDTWKALEKLYNDGLCKAIGVSNFKIEHLEKLLKESTIKPVVNQVEFHPFLYQKELMNYCLKNKILIEAYSPLTQARKLKDPKLMEIAKKYSKSSAQILIRWGLQHDIITIPRSSNNKRIEQNAEVFDFNISIADMQKLDLLNQDLRIGWYPLEY